MAQQPDGQARCSSGASGRRRGPGVIKSRPRPKRQTGGFSHRTRLRASRRPGPGPALTCEPQAPVRTFPKGCAGLSLLLTRPLAHAPADQFTPRVDALDAGPISSRALAFLPRRQARTRQRAIRRACNPLRDGEEPAAKRVGGAAASAAHANEVAFSNVETKSNCDAVCSVTKGNLRYARSFFS